MKTDIILNSLNKAQHHAVSAPLGHQLILAGAGSGKTRVLTHRIAWLIQQHLLAPTELLAVTFTNKAAHELRSRLDTLLGVPTRPLWIGTFHGLSHRFLRLHWQEAGLTQNFQILDTDDQQRLVRRVIQTLNLDEDRFPAKETQWFINKQKEQGRAPHHVEINDLKTQTQARIYQAYEETCQRASVIDFADLLLKTCHLLEKNDALRAHYQARFRCIMVDEFQDTNQTQYRWLKLFAGEQAAITIVGDDDQSIYGWRGARVENIHQFSKDYPSCDFIRLEQNYRSTPTILKAANAIIERNSGRLGKELWTAGQDGEPITIYAGFNETDEAFFIVNRIRELRLTDYTLRDMAILYRSNAQSRVLEEALMQFGIPYRVYGGLRFFDRAEIKDALAYLRFINHTSDDTSFERIINTPTRGIGDKTITSIREHAKEHNLSLWESLQDLLTQSYFANRAHQALQHFQALILSLHEKFSSLTLDKQVELVLHQTGLLEHYQKEKGEKGLTRVENLEELVNAAYQFMQDGVADDMPPLAAFLAYAALESGDEQADAYEDCVQLMTLHSSKGLEFPVVFLAGLEEELFPHYLSMHDPKAMEEERRLCYVGVTRAMRKLFMTYAEVRRTYGREAYHKPSRFLHEIPSELIHEIRFKTKVSKATNKTQYQPEAKSKFSLGQSVTHPKFGTGTVLACEGDHEHMKVKVKFHDVGTKVLIASFLQPA